MKEPAHKGIGDWSRIPVAHLKRFLSINGALSESHRYEIPDKHCVLKDVL